MRKVIWLCYFLTVISFAQETYSLKDSEQAQEKLNTAYTNPETSILLKADFEAFKGLEFFPLDEKYIIQARFVRTPGEEPFEMSTTTERTPVYEKYAEVHFRIDNEDLKLNVYRDTSFINRPGLEDYLFLPFYDLTNGIETYGGGRYLDLRIPSGDTIIIDFNRTYNPYCVYNPKYSCPIPPEENDLPVEIRAGVLDFKNP